jgi:5'-phosphate synthase pdxT subunit
VASGTGVDVLAWLSDGKMVAEREGSLVATSFHPELTADTRFHRLLADLAGEHQTGERAEGQAAGV